MDLFEAIRERRSTRKFKDKEIDEEIILKMLEAARLAPSGGNGQNHKFGVIRDDKLKEELAKAAGEQMWIADAPVIIACCSDISNDFGMKDDDDFGLQVNKLRFGSDFMDYLAKCPDRKACMNLFENSSPLIPTEHIVLTAIAHGLRSCFVGFMDIERVSSILGLPANMSCLFLLPVGYPQGEPSQKETKTLEEISFYDRWSK